MSEQNKETEIPKKKSWLKKMGWVAFLFFLLKGIAWIVVFVLAAMGVDSIV